VETIRDQIKFLKYCVCGAECGRYGALKCQIWPFIVSTITPSQSLLNITFSFVLTTYFQRWIAMVFNFLGISYY